MPKTAEIFLKTGFAEMELLTNPNLDNLLQIWYNINRESEVCKMLKRNECRQVKMFMGSIEDLMPKDHFLRDLEKLIDFSFIYEKVEPLYSNIGRSSIDPVVIVKMLLIGYFYGIDSERKLEQEIKLNIAYRWFLGLELDDSIPDHSTLSHLRRRKFKGSTLFQEIFDQIVRKCIETGLVDGKLLLTDSTHIQANASKESSEIVSVPITTSEYMKKLDKEAIEQGLIKETKDFNQGKTKKIRKSLTDPDSGMLNRPGKPNVFCYLNHQTSDSKFGIITDVYVTPGNVDDVVPHTKRLEYQIDKFGLKTKAVCADAGYDGSEVYDAMLKRGIKTYIPRTKKSNHNCKYEENFNSTKFVYNKEKDIYICPAGKELHYSSFGKKNRVKRYIAKTNDCRNCPHFIKCRGGSQTPRMIERIMHEEARFQQSKNIGTPEYYSAMRLRKIWCEGNFAHQKEQHNLRRTRMRGIDNVTEQCLLSACALNLKRLVKRLKRCVNKSIYTVIRLNKSGFFVLYRICQQLRNGGPVLFYTERGVLEYMHGIEMRTQNAFTEVEVREVS